MQQERRLELGAALRHPAPEEGLGLAPFLARYAPLDALAGREVVVHGNDGDYVGAVSGLAPDGGLCVRIDGGERVVHAGEVSVRPA